MLLLVPDIPDALISAVKNAAEGYDVMTAADWRDKTFDTARIEIMFGWNREIGKQVLQEADSRLKWIQADSAGVNQFDFSLLQAKGILLSSASGIHSFQMTESVLGMLLSHTRRIRQAVINQERRQWVRGDKGSDLSGKKVLIAGTGQIGQHLAKTLGAFDVSVYGVNRSGRQPHGFVKTYVYQEFLAALPTMDVVINLLPLTKETYHFFDSEVFSRMKKGVMFINAGRGESVKTLDLMSACQDGTIAFAGLDVFEEEPLPEAHPLWGLENVLITPHIAGSSNRYYDRLLPLFLDNLASYLHDGTLRKNHIDYTAGY